MILKSERREKDHVVWRNYEGRIIAEWFNNWAKERPDDITDKGAIGSLIYQVYRRGYCDAIEAKEKKCKKNG